MTIILMGVSGSGKSTLGKILAKKLNGLFIEGDELHPKKNIQKTNEHIRVPLYSRGYVVF